MTLSFKLIYPDTIVRDERLDIRDLCTVTQDCPA